MNVARMAPMLLGLLFAAPGQPTQTAAPVAPSVPGTAPPAAASAPREDSAAWTTLEPGLDLGVFAGPGVAPGDGKIWIARIDPSRFELRLVNASAGDSRPHTIRAWALSTGAAAAINASMFQTDGLTSVGMMRTREHQNNPRRSRTYKAVLAFDPLDPSIPRVRILDAGCGEIDATARSYGTLVQSIRMISCDGKNVWAPDEKRKSTAAIGTDEAGRVLFVHARSPWPVHDLTDALLSIGVRRAMYVEGGPEAQMFVRSGGRDVERLGAIDATHDHTGGFAWEIPNAIVAVRRSQQR